MMPAGRRPNIVVLAGGGVAHVSGGVGTLMLYLMDAWAAREDGPRIRVLDTRGAGGIAGAAWCFLRAGVSLAWLSLTGSADLVHAHMTTRGSVVRKCLLCELARLLGKPQIVHMHGADFMPFYEGLRPLWQRMIARTLRRAAHVVALGEAWRPFLERLDVQPDRIAIVMNGVPAPLCAEASERGEGPVRLLFLGRLGDRKGVPDLIAALSSPGLLEQEWTATFAGDGEVERFREAVAAAGLAERVTLPGWIGREEAASLLRRADILVLPSFHEALPMAVIEALSHRVAVVATPVGVIPELLKDDVNARLVPPGAPAELADALASLIGDKRHREALAESGHAVFLDRLDVTVIADRILALYRSAIGRSAMGGRGARQPGSTPADVVRGILDHVEKLRTAEDTRSLIARLTRCERAMVISFVNQHALNVAWREPGFADDLGRADVLLRDGIGAGFCLRALGGESGLNMNGTDFIPLLAAAFAGRRVALFGTRDPWLTQAAAACARLGCTMVGAMDGFQEDSAYVEAAKECSPDLLILGMGMPRQERLATAIAAAAGSPLVIVNGGAIADFLGGRFARAPGWMRRSGLEWAFRLYLEPARLWRRYGPGGFAFAAHVLMLRRAQRRRASRPDPLPQVAIADPAARASS